MDHNSLANLIAAKRSARRSRRPFLLLLRNLRSLSPDLQRRKLFPTLLRSSPPLTLLLPMMTLQTLSRASLRARASPPSQRGEVMKRALRLEERDSKRRKVPHKSGDVVLDLTVATLIVGTPPVAALSPPPPNRSPPTSTGVEAFVERARRLLLDFTLPDTCGASLTNRILALDKHFLEVSLWIQPPSLDYSEILTRLYFQASM